MESQFSRRVRTFLKTEARKAQRKKLCEASVQLEPSEMARLDPKEMLSKQLQDMLEKPVIMQEDIDRLRTCLVRYISSVYPNHPLLTL